MHARMTHSFYILYQVSTAITYITKLSPFFKNGARQYIRLLSPIFSKMHILRLADISLARVPMSVHEKSRSRCYFR